jgi:hypothetical protein
VNIGIGGRAASPNNDAHELPNTTSRYDPSAMSRIANINDLVNSSPPTSDDEHDVEEGHSTSFGALRIKMTKKKKKKKKKWVPCRLSKRRLSKRSSTVSTLGNDDATDIMNDTDNDTTLIRRSYGIIVFVTLSIIASAATIGLTVTNKTEQPIIQSNALLSLTPTSTTDKTNDNADPQEELEMAQRILHACSTIDLVGMSYVNNVDECKSLCKSHKCCFAKEEGTEEGCRDEQNIDCAVYVGCEALY